MSITKNDRTYKVTEGGWESHVTALGRGGVAIAGRPEGEPLLLARGIMIQPS